MAPKNRDSSKGEKAKSNSAGKAKGKGKDKDVEASAGGSGKLKSVQSINVRHILVGRILVVPVVQCPPSNPRLYQCEKHSKKEEALAKLREGAKFDEVAREFSEDKARQGRESGGLHQRRMSRHIPLRPARLTAV